MRFAFISLISLLFFNSSAQNIKLLNNLSSLNSRADLLFEQSRYEEAVPLYTKLYKRDTTRRDLAIKIGESYSRINDHSKAEYWFSKGIERTNTDQAEVWMSYAQSLIANKKHNEAKKWLELYNEYISEDQRVIKKLAALDNFHAYFKDSSAVSIEPLSINTEHVELSPTYYKNGIVFLSDQHSSEINNVMNWNQDEYMTIYYTEEKEDGTMMEPIEFHNGLNSKYHEGPLVFYQKNRIIFTRTGVRNKNTNEAHLELYTAEYDSEVDKWTNISPLPFNNDSYSVGHPAVTANGERLVFSSNMKGGYGKTDLYISDLHNGQWSQPKNLGDIINTKGEEMFPYFPNKDELVFSSDGHGGLGDLDIFRVDISGLTNTTIENLGYPYNSQNADFGYISDGSGTTGYFTSNRANGGLDDDIYHFVVSWSKIRGTVVGKGSKKPMEQIKLDMIISGKVKDTKFSDAKGVVEFISLPGEQITFEASKKGYLPVSIQLAVQTSDIGKLLDFDIEMEKIPEPVEKKQPRDNYTELMRLYNKQKAMIQVNGRIFEYREVGNYQYLVNADEKILLSKAPPEEDLPIEERAKKAVEAKGLKIGKSYFIKNIYFDLDSWDISEKAKIELNKVVEVMTTDRNVAFEINSFTDSRGSMAYNDELAFKRSQAVARFLLINDISGSRLIIESYGEQGLLNECDDSKDCNDLYHAVNRRSEFKLLMRKIHD